MNGEQDASRHDRETALELARRLLALSRTGIHFADEQYRSDGHGAFDRERYEEMGHIAARLIALHTDAPLAGVLQAWRADDGYITPKVDVRGAVFRDDRILLVRERSDGKWALPGGWADINETPTQAVEKEIAQESGFTAKAVKLAAVHDKRKRNTPSTVFHIWKLLFICEITGGSAQLSNETDGVEFFSLGALPELSTGRTVRWQIERMYAHHLDRALATEFD